MRPSRVIAALLFAAAIGTPALLAVPAWAASPTPPVAVHASPNPILAGHTVTVSGSVGPDQAGSECATGVKLLSRAFDSNQDFAGVPALGATVRPDGTFTATTTIPRSRAAGSYTITGRCGGGNLGVSATLVVRAPASPTTTPAPVPPPATGPTVTAPIADYTLWWPTASPGPNHPCQQTTGTPPNLGSAGAIPTGILAIIIDLLVGQCQYWLIPRGVNPLRGRAGPDALDRWLTAVVRQGRAD